MPLGKNKDAKIDAEYKSHEEEIMKKARLRVEGKKIAIYKEVAVSVLSSSNLEEAVQEMMEKFNITRK